MEKRLLITRPEYDDTTHYLSNWSKASLRAATSKGVRVFDLDRERATKAEVESMLTKQNPQLVILNGHGDDNMVTGHKGEPLIIGGQNETLLKGKMTYAISCKSAKELGRKAVRSGGESYLGYEDDFIFFYDPHKISRPVEDETAELFLKPAIEIIFNSLLKGNTMGESSEKSKQSMKLNINRLLSSESSKEEISLARYLWWNMRNQVCLGKSEAKL